MGIERLRGLSLAGLLLLGSCGTANLPPPAPVAIAGAGLVCRVGPGGAPMLADRGIGGTGAPALQQADKGIGGTGIDKTGLVGVITGFASICVAGSEVGYGPATPVLLDGRAAGNGELRVGQLAVINAVGSGEDLRANRVLIRHEIAGPVQAIGPGAMVQVAGQPVALAASTLGDVRPAIGEWVAVSGFRDVDGLIRATRLDAQPPGIALVAGVLVLEGGRARIGAAEVRTAPALVQRLAQLAGHDVVVSGHWSDGVLLAGEIEPDLLAVGPYGYFGADTGTVVFESFAGFADGRLVVSRAQQRGVGAVARRSVIELQRRPDGALQPFSTRDLGPESGRSGRFGLPMGGGRGTVAAGVRPDAARAFEPAPVPSRAGAFGGERSGVGSFGPANRAIDRATRERSDPGGAGPGAAPAGGGISGPYFGGGFGGSRGH